MSIYWIPALCLAGETMVVLWGDGRGKGGGWEGWRWEGWAGRNGGRGKRQRQWVKKVISQGIKGLEDNVSG